MVASREKKRCAQQKLIGAITAAIKIAICMFIGVLCGCTSKSNMPIGQVR
jgi:hypothetical protein